MAGSWSSPPGSFLVAVGEGAPAGCGGPVVLNTGDRQPEVLALCAARGYRPVPGYGTYAEEPGAVFLGKELGRTPGTGSRVDREEEQPWAS